MNSVLAEIIETGVTKTANEAGAVPVHSAISTSEGEFLQSLVRGLDPTTCLEVGLAYGISAMFVCDALTVREDTRYIVIDPNQHGGDWGDSWEGIGIANLRRAGYADISTLIEEPSYRALGSLERSGQHIDFAFIDGWHTFDFCLVDFFLIDRMLRVGGVVAFDDANWPAVRKVCRFVQSNMAYTVLNDDRLRSEPSRKRQLVEGILNRGGSKVRSLVRPEVLNPDRDVGLEGPWVAFRKDSEDSRRWDHFVDF